MVADDVIPSFHERGYAIVRNLVAAPEREAIRAALMQRAATMAARGIGDKALLERAALETQSLPLEQRFRKLNAINDIAENWRGYLANPQVLAVVQALIGNDILNKFGSAFLKPAHVGGATPWHQDIGLWRDGNSTAVNGWLAIDASTAENACLQVVPGSHKGPVIPHVTYEDSIHPELPRELCSSLHVDFIELQPGDVVFWHSHLWHYSPLNVSAHNRLGCGAVWISPAQIGDLGGHFQHLPWCMHQGEVQAFPPPRLIIQRTAA